MDDNLPEPHLPAAVCAGHAIAALRALADALDPRRDRPGAGTGDAAELRALTSTLIDAHTQLRRAVEHTRGYLHHLDNLGALQASSSTTKPGFDHVVMIGLHLASAGRSAGEVLVELRHADDKLKDLD